MKEKHLVFIIHGYTATKYYTKSLADYCTKLGYFTYNAKMKGHDVELEIECPEGTYPPFPEKDFMLTYFDDWYSSVEEQFLEYAKEGYKITLMGHSMGGVISMKLTQAYPEYVHALVILASPLYMNRLIPFEMRVPAMPLLYVFHSFIKKYPKVRNAINIPEHYQYPPQIFSLFKNFAKVRKNLKKINAPIMVIQAFDDKNVPNSMPSYIMRKVKSAHKVVKMYTIHDDTCNKHAIAWHEETKNKVLEDIKNFLAEQKVEKLVA